MSAQTRKEQRDERAPARGVGLHPVVLDFPQLTKRKEKTTANPNHPRHPALHGARPRSRAPFLLRRTRRVGRADRPRLEEPALDGGDADPHPVLCAVGHVGGRNNQPKQGVRDANTRRIQ